MPTWLKKHPEWLMALCIFLVLLVIRLVSGFNGLYGQDAHEYLRHTRALFDWLHGGEAPGPFFWPLNYPIAGVGLSHLFGKGPFSLQILSMLALPGSFLYLCFLLTARESTPAGQNTAEGGLDLDRGKFARGFLFLFFVCAPYLLRGSFLVMSDMMTLFFVCGVLFHLDRYGRKGQSRDFLMGALWIGMAVFTRYPAGVLLLPFVVTFLVLGIKFRDWKAGVVMIPVFALVILPQILFRTEPPLHFLENGLLQNASPIRWFQRSYDAPDGRFSYLLPNGLFMWINLFHPGYCFLGIGMLAFFQKNDLKGWFPKVVGGSWLGYILFVGMLPFQNSRFMLISFPLLIVALFPAYFRGIRWLKKRLPSRFSLVIRGVAGIFLLLQLGLFAGSSRSHYRLYRLEHKISSTLLAQYAGPTLYTFYVDGALRTYEVENPIINLWEQELQEANSGELVLFNEGRFSDQWKGKNPMINWEWLNREYELVKLEDFGEGWILYELR